MYDGEEQVRLTAVEELMQIEGIKEGVFNKIKDNITIYQGGEILEYE